MSLFSAILFSIGAVLDEAQGNHDGNNYLSKRKCSKSRQFLVLKWTIIGFLLAISYKSVLRALLIKVEYEKSINTINDMIESDRVLYVAEGTPLKLLLNTDPRENVKMLAKKTLFYQWVNAKDPEFIMKG